MSEKNQNEVKEKKDKKNPVRGEGANESEKRDNNFPIVGIGASAGGLEAIEAFLFRTPEDSGMAFVIISHTDPDRATMLPEILSKKSPIPVILIEDGMEPEPDTVYLPPSDKDLTIEYRVFHLEKRTRTDGLHMPIDLFFRSLAEDCGNRAGGIILSGTGTDGTQGLRMIKEKAGVTAAQRPDTARHTGMPRSAIDTGLVDYVLAPDEFSERLVSYFENRARIESMSGDEEDRPRELQKILNFLSNRTSHDFSLYKKSTLVRRIERRMSVTGSANGSEYINYLYRNPKEAETLFDDLLIGVTNFFRDPEAFAFLKDEVLPDLIGADESGKPLRIWVAGCSTGEEAYSVAMVTQEALEAANSRRKMQIFATDLDEKAINRARHGSYIKNIATDVTSERLKRFFIEEQTSYRVKSDIREPIVFAVQNLLSDPPYSGIDLMVCRNLLIYLEVKAQHRLLPLFHYVLKENGVLFMGSSESVGRFADLFEPVKKKYNIYRKKNVIEGARPLVEFPTGTRRLEEGNGHSAGYRAGDNGNGIASETEKVLLKQYTPTCIVTDLEGRILHIHGRTGMYLEDPEGKPTTRLVDKAREGIRFALSSALRQAGAGNEEIRHEGLRVRTNGDSHLINMTVKPFPGASAKNTLMVLFEDLGRAGKEDSGEMHGEEGEEASDRVIGLEQELNRVRHEYQGSLEELQSSNEELRSANEEARSSNEELQSTNEELESSREELQSLNEELTTVNAELNSKTEELSETFESIANVLESTQIAILFLNEELLVKRFTREAARLFNLIDTDVGRPISQLSHNLEYENLDDRMRSVLKDLTPFEDEVKTSDGHWYKMRIMVFRTKGNMIEGTVATFINIDAEKKAMSELEGNERRFEALVKTSSEVLYSMSPDWKEMRHLNSQEFLAETREPSRNWLEKYIPEDEQARVMEAIGKAIETKSVFELEHGVLRKDGTRGRTFSRAVPILDEDGEIIEWSGAAIDVTKK